MSDCSNPEEIMQQLNAAQKTLNRTAKDGMRILDDIAVSTLKKHESLRLRGLESDLQFADALIVFSKDRLEACFAPLTVCVTNEEYLGVFEQGLESVKVFMLQDTDRTLRAALLALSGSNSYWAALEEELDAEASRLKANTRLNLIRVRLQSALVPNLELKVLEKLSITAVTGATDAVREIANSCKRDRSKWKPEYRQIIERYESECISTGGEVTIASIFESALISQSSNGYAALLA
jgi:hypothetical protein